MQSDFSSVDLQYESQIQSLWAPNQIPRHLLVTVEAGTGGGPGKDTNMDCSRI